MDSLRTTGPAWEGAVALVAAAEVVAWVGPTGWEGGSGGGVGLEGGGPVC